MATRALAESAVDSLPLPGATLFTVLTSVQDLCDEVGDGSASCFMLHERLMQVFYHLEEIDTNGALQSETVNEFTTTLGKFWRLLDAYRDMTSIERLLHHHKLKKDIERLNTDVDRLFKMTGLAVAAGVLDWRRQVESDMRALHQQLVDMLKNYNELRDQLRSARDQHDAAVLLKDAVDKIKDGRSALSAEAQAAVQSTFLMVVKISNASVVESTPPWFLPESDLEFDQKPYARGSFAAAHRGTLDKHTRVVVKMLLPGQSGLDAQLQQSFVQEANLWFQLRHPNVVRLLGACHVSSRPFLVCEEAAHGNTHDFLAASSSHRKLMWPLLYEAAQGLEHLHTKHIAHGDVRLSNVLVTNDLKALVTDFGLNRLKNSSKAKSMTWRRDKSVVVGNWRWMAPEMHAYGPQPMSDVYGLAMTILEAYTGEPPYAEVRDENEVKDKVLSGELPMRPSDMTDRAWQLIVAMTYRDPKSRIPMKEVLDRLRELATNEPPPATRVDEALVPQAETPPQSTVALTDAQQLLRVLTNGSEQEKLDAAMRLSALTGKPEVAQEFLSASSIRVVINELKDTANPTLKEHLAHTLGNIALDPRGPRLIGSCGGVAPLVRLLSDKTERLRHSGLRALVLVVKDPLNAKMFVQAGGVSGLEYHLTSSSPSIHVEVLTQLSAVISSSEAIAIATASNRAALSACLGFIKSRHADERDAAGSLLRQLVRCESAVVALHRDGHIQALVDALKVQNFHAEDTLKGALDTLLRASNADGRGRSR